jgi:hypothetical protein
MQLVMTDAVTTDDPRLCIHMVYRADCFAASIFGLVRCVRFQLSFLLKLINTNDQSHDTMDIFVLQTELWWLSVMACRCHNAHDTCFMRALLRLHASHLFTPAH